MSLKFYLDTHIPKQVALQLRSRNIEVVRCEDIGLAEASDIEHLEYAAHHGLSVITKDQDFLRLHTEWLIAGKEHSGIFFCAERALSAIGEIVTICADYYALVEAGAGTLEDMRNLIVFV
jgi:hypothetical protein